MMRQLFLAAAAALATPAAFAASPSDADRAALERLAVELDHVWDQGNPAAIAALYTRDGSLRINNHPFAHGRDAVQRYFEQALPRRPAGARHVTRIQNIDLLTSDLALIDTHASVERDREQGGSEVLADFHNQTLAAREGEVWRFRVVRAQRMTTPAAD